MCPKVRLYITVIVYLAFSSFLFSANAVLAQSGDAGLQNAIDEVSSYFKLGVDLMYAIGSVVGLVGAVKVYNKWNSGDQDTSKVAASWFGSCIFLIVVAAILEGFFIG
uniref:DUF4134 domain-containing protein n=1 Tax=Chitinophaga rhizosphaerae TaxID=1864947 RepID=UPI000F7FF008